MSDRGKAQLLSLPSSLKTYFHFPRPAPSPGRSVFPFTQEVLLRPEVRSGILAGNLSEHLWERQILPSGDQVDSGELVKIEMLQTLRELQMRKGEQHLVLPRPHPGPFHDCLQLLGHRTISGLFAPCKPPQTHLRSEASPCGKPCPVIIGPPLLSSPPYAVL